MFLFHAMARFETFPRTLGCACFVRKFDSFPKRLWIVQCDLDGREDCPNVNDVRNRVLGPVGAFFTDGLVVQIVTQPGRWHIKTW